MRSTHHCERASERALSWNECDLVRGTDELGRARRRRDLSEHGENATE